MSNVVRSCEICWKKAQEQLAATGVPFSYREVIKFYVPLLSNCKHPQPKTKVICPMCKTISYVLTTLVKAEQPIDRPKCSTCFEQDYFVNLIPFNVPGVPQEEGEKP